MKKIIAAILMAVVSLSVSCGKKSDIADEVKTGLPAGMGAIAGTIVDDRGEPVTARVYVTGSDDSMYLAKDAIPYERPAFAARIGYSGKHFTTRGNTFALVLPPGRATVRIERGKEYVPAVDTLEIVAGGKIERTWTLRRLIDLAAQRWYSGDTHVHRPLSDLADLMRAEDLHVAVSQTVWNDKRAEDLASWLAKADSSGAVTVGPDAAFAALSHEMERGAGALLLHHTGKKEIPLLPMDERRPPDLSLMEQAHAAGGYAEIEKPWWPEAHINLALGGDLIGIANNHFTYTSYLPERTRERMEYRLDYPPGARGYALYCFDLWYAYLNCGFRAAPTAGSASGVLPNPPGYNRVYVRLDGPFSYDAWFRGLAAGRSFVTNGPILFATVNGIAPGDTVLAISADPVAEVACEVHSLVPIEKIDIIRNGSVIQSFANPTLTNNAVRVTAPVPVSRTCWIAVRCFEKREDTVRFAHTAPIRVAVDGAPFVPKRYAAEYFLKKTRELIAAAPDGKFPDEDARAAALETYRRAEEFYAGLAEGGK
ncbi:MAG: CehA/McbA family metallohydrolase [Candidatus Latescibacterota bacterium]